MFDKPFKLHFLSVIERTVSVCWIIIVLLVANYAQRMDSLESIQIRESTMTVLILLAIIAVVFIINLIRWEKTYISLEADTLVIDKQTIFAKKTTIGIQNISNVNLEQNLLQRIFGVYRLMLDTNSLTTANDTDVKILLEKNIAIKLQKTIIEMIDSKEQVNHEQETFDIEYGFGKVVLHSILSIPIGAILYAALVVCLFALGLFNPELGQDLMAEILQGVLSIILIAVPALVTILKELFKLYNFKVKREEDKVLIKYGLFTKNKYTIPVDKINAIVLKQTVLARIFGKYAVEIINVGMGDAQKESPVLFLMGSKKEITEKMKQILPEIKVFEETEAQPKNALVPIILNVGIADAICATIAFMILPIAGIIIALSAIVIVMLMYLTRRIGVHDDYITIVNGVFERKSTLIRYEKIQHIKIKENLLTNKLNIAKTDIYILAEATKIEHYTGYFAMDKFENIGNKIVERN